MLKMKKAAGLHFTYNIDEKTIDLSEELCAAYGGIPSHFDNMPYSFAKLCVHDEDVESYIEMHEDIDSGAPFATADFRIKSTAGWARVCLFRSDFDKPIVSGVVQNVSERYNLIMEEAERKQSEINLRIAKELEALQLMRAVSDSSDMIISVNLTKNDYYVISDRQLKSEEISCDGNFDELYLKTLDLVPEQYKEEFDSMFTRQSLLNAYERGEKYVYLEHLRYDDDNSQYWVSTHFMFTENPYSDDVMAIVVRRNINERRKREARQKQMLKEALASANKANHAKSDFLSHMSHDIRTPMNAIVAFTNFALKENDINVIKNDYLPKIQTSGKHLLMLINDVLEMSRIESGKTELKEKPHHLGKMSEELVLVVSPQAEAKGLRLNSEANVTNHYIYCDKLRINQVITNLLSNSIKFTPAGGTVSVTVNQEPCGEAGCAVYEFKVSDTGIGMSEEFVKNVFEPFERERTSTVSRLEGTGLGLSIVKHIVDMMNGTISVQSQPDKGTVFTVRLKMKLVENDEIVAMDINKEPQIKITAETAKEYFSGKRLLLVEDNELNRIIARTILAETGFIIEEAEDGVYAVEKIQNAPSDDYYDVVLMDIQMPIMNGYEATKAIRSLDSDRKDVRIIAVSANAFQSDANEAILSGMNAHISKPINVDELYRALLKELTHNEQTIRI